MPGRRIELQDWPDIGFAQRHEIGRHHADDRAALVVQDDRPADGAGVACEAALPETVADHRHQRAAGPVFVRPEAASEDRGNTEGREEVRRHPHRGDAFRLLPAQIDAVRRERGQGFEAPHPLLEDQEVGLRDRETVPEIAPVDRDDRQAVRLGVGERAQQGAVDHAEDRGVRADPKRQGQRRDRREAGVLAEQPQRETQVLHERVHRVLYSTLSAVIGSTSVARRAGMTQARRATKVKRTATRP